MRSLLIVFGFFLTSTALADIPRTASGRPDFSGTYDSSTLTPLVRPEEYGDNLYLTPEKAKALSDTEAKLMAEQNSASNPERQAPPDGGDGSPGAAGNVGGYNTFWIDRGTDALLVDGKFRTSIIVDPPNGQFPPMTPSGQARMAKIFAGFGRKNEGKAWWGDQPGPYDNMEQRQSAERCLLGFSGAAPSIPSLYNNFKRIVQTDGHVMILIEMIHDARVVRMNGTHAAKGVHKWMGDSVGWWDGDTLVVDTTNFNPQTAGFLTGGEHTRVEERFTLQESGDILYRFTVTDNTQWQAPWTGEYVWRQSDQRVYEYACHEGNYALGNIMRGARILEKDAITSAGGGEE
jgi:hypothetical protein